MPYIQDAVKRNRVELLCDALESGTYQQGKSALRTFRLTGTDQYCCLGVACETHIKMSRYEGFSHDMPLITWGNEMVEHPSVYRNDGTHRQISSTVMPREVIEWYGFEPIYPFDESTLTGDVKIAEIAWGNKDDESLSAYYNSATGANDAGVPFPRIARAIREEYLNPFNPPVSLP